MRRVVYHVATSVDGFIARADGSFEGFLFEGEHLPDFLASLTDDYDTVLMGRTTYEAGYAFGAKPGDPSYTEFKLVNYVFGKLDLPSDEQIHFVDGDAAKTVAELKEQPGKDIWLCGGGVLARSILDAGLLDEVILKVNPVWLGKGVPLFGGDGPLALSLVEARTYGNGVGLLRYLPRP
ncbi:dihydrofolate reductase family protein [Actinomycetes bacterium KLBMP 9759]